MSSKMTFVQDKVSHDCSALALTSPQDGGTRRSVACRDQLASRLGSAAPDRLPEAPRGQREAQPKHPAFHPVAEELSSSQEGLHQRHHVVNTARYVHHSTWNSHLTEKHKLRGAEVEVWIKSLMILLFTVWFSSCFTNRAYWHQENKKKSELSAHWMSWGDVLM